MKIGVFTIHLHVGLVAEAMCRLGWLRRLCVGWSREKIKPLAAQPTGFSHRAECGNIEIN